MHMPWQGLSLASCPVDTHGEELARVQTPPLPVASGYPVMLAMVRFEEFVKSLTLFLLAFMTDISSSHTLPKEKHFLCPTSSQRGDPLGIWFT